jgi:hypothetical protein
MLTKVEQSEDSIMFLITVPFPENSTALSLRMLRSYSPAALLPISLQFSIPLRDTALRGLPQTSTAAAAKNSK